MASGKRPNPHTLSPDFRSREKDALVRRHKLVILLNDREMDVLKRYQAVLKGKSRAALCRDAIMEKALNVLEENQPTLF